FDRNLLKKCKERFPNVPAFAGAARRQSGKHRAVTISSAGAACAHVGRTRREGALRRVGDLVNHVVFETPGNPLERACSTLPNYSINARPRLPPVRVELQAARV